MTNQEMTNIYDRLLAINLEIATTITPDPSYINQKIGECHIYLGEVERFFINVSKEISVIQRALNTSKAKYESEKDIILVTREDIKNLPNITEKMAKVNSLLKEQLKEIQDYESQLIELNNLLKAINLKHRNLIRANGDIKSLIKMIEAQIRLGNPSDEVAKGFMEEMKKGISGEDSFNNIITESKESHTIDPTVPPNIRDLLVNENTENPEEIAQEESESEESDDNNNLPEELIKEAEESLKQENILVDLESILEPVEIEKGGVQAKDEGVVIAKDESAPTQVARAEISNQKKINVDGTDLDELLKQYT